MYWTLVGALTPFGVLSAILLVSSLVSPLQGKGQVFGFLMVFGLFLLTGVTGCLMMLLVRRKFSPKIRFSLGFLGGVATPLLCAFIFWNLFAPALLAYDPPKKAEFTPAQQQQLVSLLEGNLKGMRDENIKRLFAKLTEVSVFSEREAAEYYRNASSVPEDLQGAFKSVIRVVVGIYENKSEKDFNAVKVLVAPLKEIVLRCGPEDAYGWRAIWALDKWAKQAKLNTSPTAKPILQEAKVWAESLMAHGQTSEEDKLLYARVVAGLQSL